MNEQDKTAITHADHDAETYVGSSSPAEPYRQDYRAGAPAYWLPQYGSGAGKPMKHHGTAKTFLLIGVVAVLTFLGVRFLVPHPTPEVSFEQPAAPGQSVTPHPIITMPETFSRCMPNDGITSPPPEMRSGLESNVSCAYAVQVVQAVKQAKQRNPHASRFGIAPYSEYEKETVSLSCLSSGKITHCVGGRHVDVYITL